ncbi:MAG: cytochrome C oxidase Cbb3 [Gammaproteobacteria bacterium]|nr:MAG: cytochrome C oxidase Cbb3 [Gammaproteobacteria bacterium]
MNSRASEASMTVLKESMKQADTVSEFQLVEKRFLSDVLSGMLNQVTVFGLENLSKQQNHLFISNHRDIVLDPLVLNWALLKNGFATCHCAIGDNLLAEESGKRLARLNHCFAVMRSIRSPRAMVAAMKVQSAYIRHIRFNQSAPVWIAQREGRSKDNTDKTNPALLKMLALAKPREMSFTSYIRRLNIVPVSLSYEWDPCDIQKAEQVCSEQLGSYKKTGNEDLQAVKAGITGEKGQIHCQFNAGFNKHLEEELNHLEVAARLDHAIHHGYRLFPVNIAACELIKHPLPPTTGHAFTNEQINSARAALEKRIENQPDMIQNRIKKSYAQPALNLAESG